MLPQISHLIFFFRLNTSHTDERHADSDSDDSCYDPVMSDYEGLSEEEDYDSDISDEEPEPLESDSNFVFVLPLNGETDRRQNPPQEFTGKPVGVAEDAKMSAEKSAFTEFSAEISAPATFSASAGAIFSAKS